MLTGKQRHAHATLESQHPLAHRPLGDMQLRRRRSDAAKTGNRPKNPEIGHELGIQLGFATAGEIPFHDDQSPQADERSRYRETGRGRTPREYGNPEPRLGQQPGEDCVVPRMPGGAGLAVMPVKLSDPSP